jgi:hypothetical protein
MALPDNAGRLRRQSSLQHSDSQQQQWHKHYNTHLKKDSILFNKHQSIQIFSKNFKLRVFVRLDRYRICRMIRNRQKNQFSYFSSVKLCLISVLKGKTHNQNISLFLFFISSKPKQRKKIKFHATAILFCKFLWYSAK